MLISFISKSRVEKEQTEEISILRGIRHVYIVSPLLYDIYIEYIFQEPLSEAIEDINSSGNKTNNIRYVHDSVTCAALQHILQQVFSSCENYELEMDLKKTKIMIFLKTTDKYIFLSISSPRRIPGLNATRTP